MKTATMKRRQRAFENLTPAGRRVRIAQDVLAQMTARRIKATSGTYMHTATMFRSSDSDKDMVEVLGRVKRCEACAVGSLFICAVERADALPASSAASVWDGASIYVNSDRMEDYLKQYFPLDQIRQMENAFEVCEINRTGGWDTFNGLSLKAGERMARIMKNVIRNKGTFKPKQERA